MGNYKIPNLSEEVIAGVRMGNLPNGTGLDVKRYLSINSDGDFLNGVVYIEEWSEDGSSCNVRGAYFGYAGGGEYEAGFFRIEEGDSRVLHFSESESDEYSNLYSALLFECGRFYDEDDGVYNLSDYGSDLISQGQDSDDGDGRIYMDADFDGDSLYDVSNNWIISLRFES